jgi:hypothetical protein
METQQIYFAFAAFCKLFSAAAAASTMKTGKKAQGVAEIKTLSSSSNCFRASVTT